MNRRRIYSHWLKSYKRTVLAPPGCTYSQPTFFAFCDCGILSGTSQPHRHIQFFLGHVPIERLVKTAKIENEVRPFVLPQLPFAAHIKRLDKNVLSIAEILVDGSSTVENREEAWEAVIGRVNFQLI
ncbi:hypothetical protein PIIN_11225 [Serendipita indica DSM 11827]|uniref:Uncharacterized protein n=1 Tax=Serendipita indica (strain DSM 11827) TaxID=1109443 RepID=G4U100_SERID|nr:hypothetical protein PIIN_11225 [Serendipita indica DSM 11827]